MKQKTTNNKLISIKKELERVRTILLKKHWGLFHYIDYNYEKWNDGIDGLDYAIKLIDENLGKKVKSKCIEEEDFKYGK